MRGKAYSRIRVAKKQQRTHWGPAGRRCIQSKRPWSIRSNGPLWRVAIACNPSRWWPLALGVALHEIPAAVANRRYGPTGKRHIRCAAWPCRTSRSTLGQRNGTHIRILRAGSGNVSDCPAHRRVRARDACCAFRLCQLGYLRFSKRLQLVTASEGAALRHHDAADRIGVEEKPCARSSYCRHSPRRRSRMCLRATDFWMGGSCLTIRSGKPGRRGVVRSCDMRHWPST